MYFMRSTYASLKFITDSEIGTYFFMHTACVQEY